MDDLLVITKDFFKKTEKEKSDIEDFVFMEFDMVIQQHELELSVVEQQLKNLQDKAELNEDYEICELFKRISIKIKNKYHYGV